MGRTFFRSSASIKKALAFFAPMPNPKSSILKADATTSVAAVIELQGIWNVGDIIDVEVTTNIPVTTNTITSSQIPQDSYSFAILVAADLSLETNITATAVGNTIEVLASGVAVSLLVDSVS